MKIKLSKKRPMTLDEICGNIKGTFKKFLEEENERLANEERERTLQIKKARANKYK